MSIYMCDVCMHLYECRLYNVHVEMRKTLDFILDFHLKIESISHLPSPYDLCKSPFFTQRNI
ncbi:hypothetical protein ACRRTK_004118 [Alexandromys fortis]